MTCAETRTLKVGDLVYCIPSAEGSASTGLYVRSGTIYDIEDYPALGMLRIWIQDAFNTSLWYSLNNLDVFHTEHEANLAIFTIINEMEVTEAWGWWSRHTMDDKAKTQSLRDLNMSAREKLAVQSTLPQYERYSSIPRPNDEENEDKRVLFKEMQIGMSRVWNNIVSRWTFHSSRRRKNT